MLEYTGTFTFLSAADAVYKTWYLWGEIDDEGEVVAIHYGISSNLQCTSGEILQTDCDSRLRVKAFQIAKERLEHPELSEYEVIDFQERRIH